MRSTSVTGSSKLTRLYAVAAASTVLLAVQPATAAVVTSLPNGVAQEFTRNAHQVRSPQAFGDGVTYSATNLSGVQTNSYFGYTGSFSIPTAGNSTNWGGAQPFAAIGLQDAIMSFTFDNPVAGALAEFAWSTAAEKVFTLSAYNSAGKLLEQLSFDADDRTYAKGFYGFQRAANDISRFEVKGYYFAARDLSTFTAAAGAVPEPATWAMMIMGFGLAGAALRARRGEVMRA